MSETSLQTEPTPSGTTPRKAMFIVFLVVFIDLLGFGIVLPLLPLYGKHFVEPLFEGGEKSRAGGRHGPRSDPRPARTQTASPKTTP